MLDFGVCWWDERREECSCSRGSREEEFKKSCRALAMQFCFSCGCSCRVVLGFLETRFSRVRRERGEEDVGDVGGLELGLADEVVQTRWFRRMYIRLHLQHGTHQQG